MSEAEPIVCDVHGETPATFACWHIADGIACGFHHDADAPGPWPDAWCDACDERLADNGGEWTEEAEEAADVTARCTHCYEAARARNERVPAAVRGKRVALDDAEAAALVHHAVHAISDAQAAAGARWGIGNGGTWDFDDEARTLTFTFADRPAVIADVVLLGSFSTASDSFQWAWETFEAGAPEAEEVARLVAFGAARGLPRLTTARWPATLDEADEVAALATFVLGGESLYRAPMDELAWFMLLRNLRARA